MKLLKNCSNERGWNVERRLIYHVSFLQYAAWTLKRQGSWLTFGPLSFSASTVISPVS